MGMDSSSAQHHNQEMSSQTLESMLVCTKPQQDKKPRPPSEQAQKCPRCDSTNTKFCYYNNYSLSQPRYFCKSCRRYWTKGGTLRNVPVGGGCRKNKRSSSSTSSSSSSAKRSQDHMTTIPSPFPCLGGASSLPYDSNDLSLAIARLQKGQLGLGLDDHDFSMWANPNMPHHHNGGGVLGNGFLETHSSGMQNLYYGMGMGMGIGIGNPGMENEGMGMGMRMGVSGSQEMGIPYEELLVSAGSTAVTTVKQEIRDARESDQTRVLFGFPWQNIGGDGNTGEYDSGRQSWNGIGSASNWQGLLNSPLM